MLAELLGSDAGREMLYPKTGPARLGQAEGTNQYLLDADVVGAFKDSGAGGQKRINNALRAWLKAHPEI